MLFIMSHVSLGVLIGLVLATLSFLLFKLTDWVESRVKAHRALITN